MREFDQTLHIVSEFDDINISHDNWFVQAKEVKYIKNSTLEACNAQ